METNQTDSHDTISIAGLDEVGETRPSVPAGRAIGRYIVIEEIGEGGMGLVLRAYDPKLGREVALKILKPGAVSDERRARLIREAQAMAKLTHPNVVAVYDVEESGEQVVLAMEYVAGQTLGDWLREKKRKPAEIVKQFIEAGQGLAAAHAVGLMHRDFKPANVLVSKSGQVKVTDFGLARLNEAPKGNESQAGMGALPVGSESGQPGGAPPLLTQAGRVLGTPAYMAPEQHAGDALGPATDQYAFSASLWQALTGGLPFSANTLEALLAMKSTGAPEWPRRAAGVPKRWVRAIRRGLCVKPEERWPKLEELLHELRYDPARAHRLQLAAGLCGIALAGAAGARVVWRAQVTAGCEAEGERINTVWNGEVSQQIAKAFAGADISYATDSWSHAAPRVEAYAREWRSRRTEACLWGERDGRSIRDVLERSRSCFEEHLARLKSLVEQWKHPDGTAIQRAVAAAYGLPFMKECRDETELLRRELVVGNETLRDLTTRLAVAEGLLSVGRYERALVLVGEVREQAKARGLPRLAAAAWQLTGRLQENLGRFKDARKTLEEAYREAEVLGDDFLALSAANQLTFTVGYRLAAQADGLNWHSLAAMKIDRLKLGSDHPLVASTRSNLAAVLDNQGRYQEAEREMRGVLAIREKTLGSDHPDVASSFNNLGLVCWEQGRLMEAETAQLRALAIREKALGPDHPDVALSINNLAIVLGDQERYQEAEAWHRRALAIREKALGPSHPDTAQSIDNLAIVLSGQGKYREAEMEQRRALAIREKALGPNHPNVAVSILNLADVLLGEARVLEAEAEYRRALAVLEKALGPVHPDVAIALFGIGISLKRQGRLAEAVPLFERTKDIREKTQVAPDFKAEVLFELGQALWSRPGERSRARENVKRVIELLQLVPSPKNDKARAEAERFLDEHR